MREDDVLIGALLEDACLTLDELSRACTVERDWGDFDAVPELAALVADLFEELDDLRHRLRRAGFN